MKGPAKLERFKGIYCSQSTLSNISLGKSLDVCEDLHRKSVKDETWNKGKKFILTALLDTAITILYVTNHLDAL